MGMTTPELKIGNHAVMIRRAVDSELNWCAEQMASTDPWHRYKCSVSWCTNVLKWPGSFLFVADAGRPIGFILLHSKGFLGSPYIAAAVIAEEYRERGIGTGMLHFAETVFAQERHVYLCVSSFNAGAFALYQRHGFITIGELPDFIADGHSEFLMCKRLR